MAGTGDEAVAVDDTDLPEDSEVVSFREAIRQLPRATETTEAYENPYTGE